MAQAALLLMGEGEAFYDGERLPGTEAMRRAGIEVPDLHARDGLAAINGSNLLTAMSAIHIYDMERLLKQAEIASSRTIQNCTNCAVLKERSFRRATSASALKAPT